jgi:hypothetical protein
LLDKHKKKERRTIAEKNLERDMNKKPRDGCGVVERFVRILG